MDLQPLNHFLGLVGSIGEGWIALCCAFPPPNSCCKLYDKQCAYRCQWIHICAFRAHDIGHRLGLAQGCHDTTGRYVYHPDCFFIVAVVWLLVEINVGIYLTLTCTLMDRSVPSGLPSTAAWRSPSNTALPLQLQLCTRWLKLGFACSCRHNWAQTPQSRSQCAGFCCSCILHESGICAAGYDGKCCRAAPCCMLGSAQRHVLRRVGIRFPIP